MEEFVELLEKFIQTENNNEDTVQGVSRIANGIMNGQLAFYQFVECLGKYLTDVNVDHRAKGVKLLELVISKLKGNYLKDAEVHTLVVFLCERLADHESVASHAVKSLYSLITYNCDVLCKEDIFSVLTHIFQDFYTQTRNQQDRHYVFLIFQALLRDRLHHLKEISFEFVSGFIQAIDGEKDPRNLIILFGLLPFVVQNFDIEPFVEQLFEVTGCYFPIDYSPPPNDSRGIRKEDLVLGLRSCMASTSRFAEYCLPLLLEKMGSDLESAKLDTFDTLETCAKVYGCDGLKNFYSDIWKGIRREVFSSPDPDLEKAALKCLTAVVKTASLGVVQRSSDDFFGLHISSILEESLSYLNASDLKLIGPTTKLLNAIAMASVTVCDRVLRMIIPLLLQHYALENEWQQRKLMIDALNTFLDSYLRMASGFDGESPLLSFKSALIALYYGAVETDAEIQLRLAAVHGFVTISVTPSLLNEDEILRVAKLLMQYTIRETEQSLRLACLSALSNMSKFHAALFSKSVVPDVLDIVKSTTDDNSFAESTFERHLNILSLVVQNDVTLSEISPVLILVFQSTLQSGVKWKLASILHCFKRLADNSQLTLSSSSHWCKSILLKLLQIVVSHGCDPVTARDVADIFLSVVPLLNIGEATELLAYSMGILEGLAFSGQHINYFKVNSQHTYKINLDAMIIFIESILNAVRREIFNEEALESRDALDRFLQNAIIQLEDERSSEGQVLALSRSIASIINKMNDGVRLNKAISTTFGHVRRQNLLASTMSVVTKQHLVHLLVWVTKALVIRGHTSAEQFTEELFACMEDESISELAAGGFQEILTEIPQALNPHCHANVRLLYKQRFFLMTCQRLVDGFNNAREEIRYNFLTALVHQACHVPNEVFASEVVSMLPLFVRGLLSDTPSLLTAILSTLSKLMADSTDFVEAYVDTLIPHLLRLSTFKNSMKVRILALDCIRHLVKLPLHVGVKHKQEVVQRLGETLDDPKRLVRKAATTARCSWFTVGS